MEQDKLWAVFEKSGKVHDYLRYCGIDRFDTVNAVPTQEDEHETDNRRTDHTRK